MKNFKINMNRPQLTDADLAGKGDFGKLLKTYKAMKTPFFKKAKFWFGSSAVLVASVAAVILYSNLSTGANSSPAPFINPPVAEANIKPATYIVDPAQDSNIIHASGSKLHIPANAFLDDDGKPAKGPDRKSTRPELQSRGLISYAVFCLKKE